MDDAPATPVRKRWIAKLAVQLMRVDAPRLFVVALLILGAGSRFRPVPASLATPYIVNGGPNAVFATVYQLFHIACELLLTIGYPLAIFAIGRIIADAIRANQEQES